MLVPDYLIVAWAAPAARWLRLDFGHFTAEQLADCRRVGRGDPVEDDGLDRALSAACHFWYLVLAGAFTVAIAFAVLVAAILGHEALGGPVPPRVFGGLLGVAAFGGFEYAFTMARSKYMRLGRLGPQGPGLVQPWAVLAARPKLRDSVISLVAGILVGIGAMGSLLEQIPR